MNKNVKEKEKKKKNNRLVIVTSLNCLYLKGMSILHTQARSDSVYAFDFRCRHAARSLVERAFYEYVKRLEYARSFSALFLLLFCLKRN